MRFKHEHHWRLQNTFCGGGTNGSVKVCECGAKLTLGVITRAIKGPDGKSYFRDEGIKRYARSTR